MVLNDWLIQMQETRHLRQTAHHAAGLQDVDLTGHAAPKTKMCLSCFSCSTGEEKFDDTHEAKGKMDT